MKQKKPMTRAQAAGVNVRAYAGKAAKFVDQTRSRLQKIAYEWDEVDSSVDWAATDLERALDEFDKSIKESIERLKEPVDEE